MLSLSGNNQAYAIKSFNSTSRYLHDLLDIDNPYCNSGNLDVPRKNPVQ